LSVGGAFLNGPTAHSRSRRSVRRLPLYAMPRFSIVIITAVAGFIITAVAGALLAVAPLEMFRPWSGGRVPHATQATASVPASNAVVVDVDRSRKGDRLSVPHAANTDVTFPESSVEPGEGSIVGDRFERVLLGVGPVPGSTIILKTITVQKPIALQTIPVLVPPKVFEIERGRPSPAQPITCESHPIISSSDRLVGPCYA
jgi:hypothetical protein